MVYIVKYKKFKKIQKVYYNIREINVFLTRIEDD